jgi:hypothetical protein
MKALIFFAFALMGCSSESETQNLTNDWKSMSLGERKTALNAIADSCNLGRSAFELLPDDELRMHPDPASSYESVDCALDRIKKLRGFGNVGFVGNEAYVEDKK